MVLQQHPPEGAKLLARAAAGQRVEWLAALEEQSLAGGVRLLDPDAGRVHAAQDRPVAAAHDLACDDARARRHHRGVLLETRNPRVHRWKRLVQRGDRLG